MVIAQLVLSSAEVEHCCHSGIKNSVTPFSTEEHICCVHCFITIHDVSPKSIAGLSVQSSSLLYLRSLTKWSGISFSYSWSHSCKSVLELLTFL